MIRWPRPSACTKSMADHVGGMIMCRGLPSLELWCREMPTPPERMVKSRTSDLPSWNLARSASRLVGDWPPTMWDILSSDKPSLRRAL